MGQLARCQHELVEEVLKLLKSKAKTRTVSPSRAAAYARMLRLCVQWATRGFTSVNHLTSAAGAYGSWRMGPAASFSDLTSSAALPAYGDGSCVSVRNSSSVGSPAQRSLGVETGRLFARRTRAEGFFLALLVAPAPRAVTPRASRAP